MGGMGDAGCGCGAPRDRAWIATQPAGSAAFGASAVFTRKPGA
jgi:hypothetical protein